MADNTTLNTGAGGDVIATDDIGGVKHQRVKITLGADGVSDGDVESGNPMPTAGNVAHDGVDAGNPIKVGGRAETTLPAAAAAGDRVDAIYTTQGAATVAGVDGTTPRSVAVNASGQLEVDLAAQQAGNIGVDIAAQSLSPIVVTDDGTALLVDGSATTQPVSSASDLDISPSHTRNEAFKEAAAIGGELDDTATTAATEGNVSPVRITAQRAVHSNLRSNDGTELGTAANPVVVTDDGAPILVDGSGVTQPVSGTVTANAGTGPFPVSDNAGSLTVDAPVGTPVNVQIGDGTDTAAVSAAGALVVDGSAVTQPVSGTVTADAGTGFPTTYTEDDAGAGAEVGVFSIGRRQDADTSPVSLDGDYHGLVFDAAGALKVNVKTSALPTGAATAANQLPDGHNVTVDNAGGASAVNIQDGGNSITVDGTVTADAGTGHPTVYTEDAAAPANPDGLSVQLVREDAPTLQGADGDWVAHRATGYGAAYVQIVDSAGSFVDTFGGGTQYTEDAVAPADPVGTAVALVREDAPVTIAADGDIVAQRATQYGAAYVQIVDSAGSFVDTFGGGTQYTEDAAAPADPVGTAVALVREDGPTLIAADGDIVAQRATGYGAAYVQILDSSGNFIDTFGGTGGTAQADRSAFTDGTTNMTPIGGVFNETDTQPTEDQAAAVRINANRALHTTLRDTTGEVGLGVYVHSAVAISTPTGPSQMLVRDDTPGAIGSDGDWLTRRASASGAAYSILLDSSHNFIDFPHYTQDAVAPANPTGQALALVRDDAPVTIGADGDIVTAKATQYGAQYVQIVDSAGSFVDTFGGGTEYTEDDALPANPVGGVLIGRRADTPASVTADGDAIAINADQRGSLHTILRTDDGGSAMDDTNSAIRCNIVAGSSSGTEFNEDDPAAGGEAGPMILGVRRDADTSPVSADGDFHTLVFDATGKLKVEIFDGGDSLTVDATALDIRALTNADVVTAEQATAANLNAQAVGNVANDVADAGNPIKTGGRARTTAITAVATDDRVDQIMSTTGGALVSGSDGGVPRDIAVNASGQLEVDIAAQQAGNIGVDIAAQSLSPLVVTDDGTAILVDGSGVTQPVSGTVTANAGTGDFLSISAHTRNEAFKESTAIGGELDDTATTAATEGNVSPVRITAQRGLHANLRANDGTEIGTAAAPVRTDPTGTTTQPVSGTVTADAGTGFPSVQTEDNASAGGETGLLALGYRQDADTSPVTADGDFHGLIFDSLGNLKVNVKAGSAGGTEFTEDAAGAGGEAGPHILGRRQDGDTSPVDTDGDYHGLIFDNAGALKVNVKTSALPSGAATAANQLADNHQVTANAGTGDFLSIAAHTTNEALKEAMAIGGQLDDTATTAATENNVAPVRITAQRGMHTNLRNASGTEIATASNPVRTDPTGTTTQPVSIAATVSTNLAQIAGTTTNVNAGNAAAGTQRVVLATDQLPVQVRGPAAHDAAVSGNPLLCGAEARTSTPTAVGNGDAVRLQADKAGRLVTTPFAPRDLVTRNNITLSSTTETTLIAALAGTFRDLTHLTLTNTSSTAVRVDIRDSTGGTVRLSMMLAADGGGAVIPFPVPYKQTTANNNWTAQLSGAVTDVRISAQAVDRT